METIHRICPAGRWAGKGEVVIHSTPGSAWNEIEDIHDQVDAVRQRLLNLERRLARLEARLELEELGLAPEPQPRPRPAARSRRAMMSSLD